jgi:hypothetical protein
MLIAARRSHNFSASVAALMRELGDSYSLSVLVHRQYWHLRNKIAARVKAGAAGRWDYRVSGALRVGPCLAIPGGQCKKIMNVSF